MMKLKFVMRTMLMLVAFCLPFVLTSCDDDEDEVVTVNYSIGFDAIQSTGIEEVREIESVFIRHLGVDNGEFVYTGTVSECDQRVIEACKKAELELSTMDFKGTYKVAILNYKTAKYVFVCNIPS